MNSRKYPRTMQSAFGPHTDHRLHPMPEPMHMADKIVLWGCGIATVLLLALVVIGVVQ